MKTIQYNIYKYRELSDEAKQTARKHFEKNYDDSPYADDARASAKLAQEIYNKFKNIDGEICGTRLYAWIVNNIQPEIELRKFYYYSNNSNSIHSYYSDGSAKKYYKRGRFSRIQIDTDWSCGLSGMCYDYNFLKPIVEFMANPTDKTSNEDLARVSLDCIFRELMEQEYMAFFEEDQLSDYADINDYHFDEHGRIANIPHSAKEISELSEIISHIC